LLLPYVYCMIYLLIHITLCTVCLERPVYMQLALISDIHGNLIALDAVLADLAARNIEHVLCLGDVAAGGPQSRGVIARLQEIACPIVVGNTDAWLLHPQLIERRNLFAQNIQDIELWDSQQLTEDDKAFLRTFNPTIEWPLENGQDLLAYHGSPRSFNEGILPTTPDEVLEQAFANTDATIYAGGHTHAQMFRRYKDKLVLNAGSVGLAWESASPSGDSLKAPWAEYAIVNIEGYALNVELRRVPFNVEEVIEATLASGMPHAEWSANRWSRA
jgi:predicted phosphodiesterase